jgi:branched-chain amino acid transport system ATP-binding protein
MAAIIDARGLNKAFGAVTAAKDVNAAIERDSVVGMIGSNGAGKTTFVNMVTGYLKPDSGEIHFEGRDITQLAPRDITRLGICRSFQIPQLYNSLSVFDNIMAALGIVLRNAGLGGYFSRAGADVPGHGVPATVAAERLLERFGLAAYSDHAAQVLPGGVRKLLDIALAMAVKPKVLLLDEPTSGVAAEEKFGIMDLIMHAVRAEGTTVLFVEHDMDVVARYAQRVLAFYDGRIIADAAPDVALADPEVRKYIVGQRGNTPGHA